MITYMSTGCSIKTCTRFIITVVGIIQFTALYSNSCSYILHMPLIAHSFSRSPGCHRAVTVVYRLLLYGMGDFSFMVNL